MGDNSTAVMYPRKLVVSFGGFINIGSVKPGCGDRQQLVYHHGYLKLPSRLDRFMARLRVTKRDRPLLDAVKSAYAFITRQYVPGDQITLIVGWSPDRDTEDHLKAAEILARHLHNGTRPANLPSPKYRAETPTFPIRIYAIMVWVLGEAQTVSALGHQLKSRFPPGLEHTVCWTDYYFGSLHCCSTSFDIDGSVISRDIRFSETDKNYSPTLEQQLNPSPRSLALVSGEATSHIVYWAQETEPSLRWENHQPIWTHVLDGSSRESPLANTILEMERPTGMYHYELRMYRGLPWLGTRISVLVWKACRKQITPKRRKKLKLHPT